MALLQQLKIYEARALVLYTRKAPPTSRPPRRVAQIVKADVPASKRLIIKALASAKLPAKLKSRRTGRLTARTT
jgi:hypothetical protein